MELNAIVMMGTFSVARPQLRSLQRVILVGDHSFGTFYWLLWKGRQRGFWATDNDTPGGLFFYGSLTRFCLIHVPTGQFTLYRMEWACTVRYGAVQQPSLTGRRIGGCGWMGQC